ncbi:hypothetical protein [Phyllobacterium sp. K27]
MAIDVFSLMFWMTVIGFMAILLATYESDKIQKSTDERLAEIAKELKRRVTPAE